jgi:hypothetical protein
MMNQDEEHEKKVASSRGRIMQVVEVEEDASKEKIDMPVPTGGSSEQHVISKDDDYVSPESHQEHREKIYEEEEKPDISSSFPMHENEHQNELREPQTNHEERYEKEIPPLKQEEKRDIVSELFDTKERTMSYPDISLDKKSSRFGFIIWVFILLGIVLVIGAGLLFLKNRSSSQIPVSSVVPTLTNTPIPIASETPIATPSGKISPTPSKTATTSAKPKGLTIQVLNGSGKSGVASTMKKYLEEKGYTVVGTGNAKNFEYEKTDIFIKTTKTSFLDKLKTDLSEKYVLGSTSATLEESASYEAQVIIGKE